MSVKVKLGPAVTDLIRAELSNVNVPGLSKTCKNNLIDSIVRGISWLTVFAEASSIAPRATWFESTELDDFDMSEGGRGVVFGMTGMPFLEGCWQMNIRSIQERRALGLNPFFVNPNQKWNKVETQYEFLTRGWRVAAVVFVEYQS